MMEEDTTHKPWEADYERSWEALKEDAEGHLQGVHEDEAYKAKRRRLFDRPSSIRLGMMRHLFVVLDASRSMTEKDLKPSRIICALKVLEKFVAEFFDQNPISQLGIITTRNGRAEKLTELNCNPKVHSTALSHVKDCSGDPSLQNSLEMAIRGLEHVPGHASKEVVVIMGSLISCDPGNVFRVIDMLKVQFIRCSIIGLAAEVHLCKNICQTTQGSYDVILDEAHFRDVLLQHCRPPPAKENSEATLIKMGFPKHLNNGPLSACLCHLEQRNPDKITSSGYFCPRCGNKYCELPVECQVCALTLVLAPHLARSYYHLFPLPMFIEEERQQQQVAESSTCSGCQVKLQSKIYACPGCSEPFCIDCDLYIHETLHTCPGCSSQVQSGTQLLQP